MGVTAIGSITPPPALLAAMGEAQALGILGEMPLADQVRHASGFAEAWTQGRGERSAPRSVVDLGSGGGMPGLVLALAWPSAQIVLLDSSAKRVDFLRRAIVRCGLDERVRAVGERAETAGRSDRYRSGSDLVVARSFGPPAVTAECAAPFLMVGGRLIVSEPPPDDQAPDRWSSAWLAQLGLVDTGAVRGAFGYRVLEQVRPCPDRYPRRVGVPAKRPLS